MTELTIDGRTEYAEDHDIPDVQRSGRRGGRALYLDLRELEDREHDALRRRRARTEGLVDDRNLRARRTGVRSTERRPIVHLRTGHLALSELRDPGRDRRVLGEALRRRREGALRVAHGQVRRLVADQSSHPGRDAG